MANLRLSHIYKVYENGHKAVNDFNIDIEDKEFIVFVGPSGCGKSTTLRMIAGLEEITAGDLFIGDTLVNDMEPKDRDIAMVFQNYALYPHMTVYDNMAFSLKNKHVPNDQIKERVLEAARILDIEEYLERKPKAMSGGQRQRVALGRAIVRNPKVFLLDEPLSNLDAKLRAQMRTEITKLHKKLQTTFIYVTHDQVEAMTMGTRIVVMKDGVVQQIDTPLNLYNKPKNKFVAGFIGTPQMNFFDVTLKREGENVVVTFDDGKKFDVPYETVAKVHSNYLDGVTPVILGIRPDHLSVCKEETGIKAKVNVIEQLGNESIIYGQLSLDEEISLKSKNQIIIKIPSGVTYEIGDILNVKVDTDRIHLFDKESELTLLEDIPHFTTVTANILSDGKIDLLGSKVALPKVFKDVLGNRDSVDIQISPDACIDDGKDFKLDVHKVETFGDVKLVTLKLGDSYLYLKTDKSVKAGDKFSFSLHNDRLRLVSGDEVLLEPVQKSESLLGTFIKQKEKVNFVKKDGKLVEATGMEGTEEKLYVKSRVKFYYNIDNVLVHSPMEKVVKITTIEGPSCYKKQYKYVIDRDNIHIGEPGQGLHAKVLEIVDYGNVCYAKLDIDGQSILINVDREFNEKEVNVYFDGNDVEVYQIEIDMRIC